MSYDNTPSDHWTPQPQINAETISPASEGADGVYAPAEGTTTDVDQGSTALKPSFPGGIIIANGSSSQRVSSQERARKSPVTPTTTEASARSFSWNGKVPPSGPRNSPTRFQVNARQGLQALMASHQDAAFHPPQSHDPRRAAPARINTCAGPTAPSGHHHIFPGSWDQMTAYSGPNTPHFGPAPISSDWSTPPSSMLQSAHSQGLPTASLSPSAIPNISVLQLHRTPASLIPSAPLGEQVASPGGTQAKQVMTFSAVTEWLRGSAGCKSVGDLTPAHTFAETFEQEAKNVAVAVASAVLTLRDDPSREVLTGNTYLWSAYFREVLPNIGSFHDPDSPISQRSLTYTAYKCAQIVLDTLSDYQAPSRPSVLAVE